MHAQVFISLTARSRLACTITRWNGAIVARLRRPTLRSNRTEAYEIVARQVKHGSIASALLAMIACPRADRTL